MLRIGSRLEFNIFVFFFFFFWFLGRCVSGKISLPNNIKLNCNRNEERGTRNESFKFYFRFFLYLVEYDSSS